MREIQDAEAEVRGALGSIASIMFQTVFEVRASCGEVCLGSLRWTFERRINRSGGLLMHALAPSGLHNSHCQLKSRCRAPTRSCLSSSHTVKSLSEQMKPPAQHCRGTLSRNSHSPAPTGLTKSWSCHETLASDQGSPCIETTGEPLWYEPD